MGEYRPLAELLLRQLGVQPPEGEKPSALPVTEQLQPSAQPQPPVSEKLAIPQAPSVPISKTEEESWPMVIGKSIGQGFGLIGQGLLSGVSAIAEALGRDPAIFREMEENIEKTWTPKVGESYAKAIASGVVSSTVNSLASFLLAKGVGVNPLATFGVLSGAVKYGTARREGATPSEAFKAAVPVGISESLTEIIPFEAIFKDVGKPLVKRLLKLYGGELIGENINTIVENIVDKTILKKPVTLDQFLHDLLDTTLITLGQTTLTGGLGMVLTRKKPEQPETPPESEEPQALPPEAPKVPSPVPQIESPFNALKETILKNTVTTPEELKPVISTAIGGIDSFIETSEMTPIQKAALSIVLNHLDPSEVKQRKDLLDSIGIQPFDEEVRKAYVELSTASSVKGLPESDLATPKAILEQAIQGKLLDSVQIDTLGKYKKEISNADVLIEGFKLLASPAKQPVIYPEIKGLPEKGMETKLGLIDFLEANISKITPKSDKDKNLLSDLSLVINKIRSNLESISRNEPLRPELSLSKTDLEVLDQASNKFPIIKPMLDAVKDLPVRGESISPVVEVEATPAPVPKGVMISSLLGLPKKGVTTNLGIVDIVTSKLNAIKPETPEAQGLLSAVTLVSNKIRANLDALSKNQALSENLLLTKTDLNTLKNASKVFSKARPLYEIAKKLPLYEDTVKAPTYDENVPRYFNKDYQPVFLPDVPTAKENLAEEAERRGNVLVFRVVRDYDEAADIVNAVRAGKPWEGFRRATSIGYYEGEVEKKKVNSALKKGKIPVYTSLYPTVSRSYSEGAQLFIAIEYSPEGLIHETRRVSKTRGKAYSALFPDTEQIIDAKAIKNVYFLTPSQIDLVDTYRKFFSEQVRQGAFKGHFKDKDKELVRANVESTRNLRPFVETPAELSESTPVNKGDRVILATGNVEEKLPAKKKPEVEKKPPVEKPPIPEEKPSAKWAEKYVPANRIVFSTDTVALVESYSLIGKVLYVGLTKDGKLTKVDIDSYKGKAFSEEELQLLRKAKQQIVEQDKKLAEAHPNGPFESDKIVATESVPGALLNLLKSWASLLKLDVPIFLVNPEDLDRPGADDKYKLYGVFSAIKSVKGTKAKASTRRIADKGYCIHISLDKNDALNIELLAHELGHIIEKELLAKESPEVRNQIKQAWADEMKRLKGSSYNAYIDAVFSHFLGETQKVEEDLPESALADAVKSFSEWFAHQVARWATTSEKPMTAVEKFFKKVADALKKLYSVLNGSKKVPVRPIEEWLNRRAEVIAEGTLPKETPTEPSAPKSIDDILKELREEQGEAPSLEPEYIFLPKEVLKEAKTPLLKGLGSSLETLVQKAMELYEKYKSVYRSPQALAEVIWKQTGWILGRDGRWRFEIDDSDMQLKSDGLKEVETLFEKRRPLTPYVSTSLGKLINHPVLFEWLPELKDLEVRIKEFPNSNIWGRFHPDGWIELNTDLLKNLPKLKDVFIHEIQHYVQDRFALAKGSSKDAVHLVFSVRENYISAIPNLINHVKNLVTNKIAWIDLLNSRLSDIEQVFLEKVRSEAFKANWNKTQSVDLKKELLYLALPHDLQRLIAEFSYLDFYDRANPLQTFFTNLIVEDITEDTVRQGIRNLRQTINSFKNLSDAIVNILDGNNPQDIQNVLLKYFRSEIYSRVAGEAEAFEVERRRAFTTAQRFQNVPSWTGLSMDDLLLAGAEGPTTSEAIQPISPKDRIRPKANSEVIQRMAVLRIDPQASLVEALEEVYSNFEPLWTDISKTTGVPRIPNLGKPAVFRVPPEASLAEAYKKDFIISAQEWVLGTKFKSAIKAKTISPTEAAARMKFFDNLSENIFNMRGLFYKLDESMRATLKFWGSGNLYPSSKEDQSSLHIANVVLEIQSITNSINAAKKKDPSFRANFSIVTLQDLIQPQPSKLKEVKHLLSSSLAYTLMDHYLSKRHYFDDINTLEELKDDILAYVVRTYRKLIGSQFDPESFVVKDLTALGLSVDEIKKIVGNSHIDLVLQYLQDFFFRTLDTNMGLHRIDTPLGWVAGIWREAFDTVASLKTMEYLSDKTQDLVIGEANKVFNMLYNMLLPFINAGKLIEQYSPNPTARKFQKAVAALGKTLSVKITPNKYKEFIQALNTIWTNFIQPVIPDNFKAVSQLSFGEAQKSVNAKSFPKVFQKLGETLDTFAKIGGLDTLLRATDPKAETVLFYLAKHSAIPEVKAMAKLLLSSPNAKQILSGIGFSFSRSLKYNGIYYPYHSTYYGGEIVLNSFIRGDALELTVLHEISHALTYHILEANPSEKAEVQKLIDRVISKLSDEEKEWVELYKQLKDENDEQAIHDKIRNSKNKAVQRLLKKFDVDEVAIIYYALTDPHEFINLALCSLPLRIKLLELDAESRSLYHRIVAYLKKLFKIPVDDTLWEETVGKFIDLVNKSGLDYVNIWRRKEGLPEIRLKNVSEKPFSAAQLKAVLGPEYDPNLRIYPSDISLNYLISNVTEESPLGADEGRSYMPKFMRIPASKSFVKSILKSPQVAAKLEDINAIRKQFGLPFWTALQNKAFMPLFSHTVKALEDKNLALYRILESGQHYFEMLSKDLRKKIEPAIRISDALNWQFTSSQLKNFSSFSKQLTLLLEMLPNLSQQERVARANALGWQIKSMTDTQAEAFAGFARYYIKQAKIVDLSPNEINGYFGYKKVIDGTTSYISELFLHMVVNHHFPNWGLNSDLINVLLKKVSLNAFPQNVQTVLQEKLKILEKSSLFKKWKLIDSLKHRLRFYAPRYRDKNAEKMIVAVDPKVFDPAFAKAYRDFRTKGLAPKDALAKAYEVAYTYAAEKDAVFLRKHISRFTPNADDLIDEARKAFPGKKVLVLPNYQLAESVYGNVTEGDLGAFLATVFEKAASSNITLSGDLIEKIGSAIEEAMLAKSKAQSRFISRKDYLVSGYNMEDTDEELFTYVNNSLNYIARMSVLVRGLPLLNLIDPKQQKNLRDYAHQWLFNQLKPQTRADRVVGKVKALMFFWFISGVIRTAAVQATQNFITAVPAMNFLYKVPPKKAVNLIVAAGRDLVGHKDIKTNPNLTADEKAVLEAALNSGITAAQFINQLYDEIVGFDSTFLKLTRKLSFPFAYMEELNRKAAVLALYRYLRDTKTLPKTFDDTLGVLSNFVYMTHFLMGRLNLPNFATGKGAGAGISRLALTFRSYTANLIELWTYMLTRPGSKYFGMNKYGLRAFALSLAAIALFGGLYGLPFFEDILRLLERLLGIPVRVNFAKAVGGPESPIALAAVKGVPSLFGIDLSGSLKINFPTSPSDLLESVFGIYGGLSRNIVDSLIAFEGSDPINAVYRALPQVIGNPLKAVQAYQGLKNPFNKVLYDEHGQPIKASLPEALLIGTGFKPIRLGVTQLYKGSAAAVEAYFRKERDAIYNKSRTVSTPQQWTELIKDIVEYNKKASAYGMGIPKITLTSLARARKPVRSKLAEVLAYK